MSPLTTVSIVRGPHPVDEALVFQGVRIAPELKMFHFVKPRPQLEV